jgi:hypothetical protein
VCLLASFLSLVVAALLFSILAGEPGERRLRPLVETACISWIMSLAVVQMTVSIAWLLRAYRADDVVVRFARYLVHVAIAAAALGVSGILSAPLFLGLESQPIVAESIWAVTGSLLLISIPAGILRRRARPIANLERANLPALISVVCMGLVYGLIAALPDNAVRDIYRQPLGYIAMLLSVGVLGLLFTLYEGSLPELSEGPVTSAGDPDGPSRAHPGKVRERARGERRTR